MFLKKKIKLSPYWKRSLKRTIWDCWASWRNRNSLAGISTGSPCLRTTHLATIWGYSGAERGVFMTDPHSCSCCSVPMVTWSQFRCSVSSLQLRYSIWWACGHHLRPSLTTVLEASRISQMTITCSWALRLLKICLTASNGTARTAVINQRSYMNVMLYEVMKFLVPITIA